MVIQENVKRIIFPIIRGLINGENYNVLISGPSGHGKTLLAIFIKRKLQVNGINSEFIYPDNSGLVRLNPQIRIHIIDEAHKINNYEYLYKFMDGPHSIFIITNRVGDLPDPVVNRCISVEIGRYTSEELKRMISRKYVGMSDNIKDYIIKICHENPRRIRNFLTLIGVLKIDIPDSPEELEEIMRSLGYEKGLSKAERDYISALERLGGKSSISQIIGITGFDEKFIRNSIEPSLLEKSLIRISNVGRVLVREEEM